MAIPIIINASLGLALGSNLIASLKLSDEEGQMGALGQLTAVNTMSSLAGHVISKLPPGAIRNVALVTNLSLPAAGLVLCPTAATVKEGSYEKNVQQINQATAPYSQHLANLLPESLNENSKYAFNYIADHTAGLTQAGAIVTMVALPFFGLTHMAAGVAVPLVYHSLERRGLIPDAVSNLVERYLPTLINVTSLISGGTATQATTLTAMAMNVPAVNRFVQKKVDAIVLKKFRKEGISLEDLDTPWVYPNNLSFQDIERILDDEASSYSINTPHCSKPIYTSTPLPENHQFEQLLNLFESTPWAENYPLLLPAFRDDDLFLDMLRDEFPEAWSRDLKENFESYINVIAQKFEMPPSTYLAFLLTGKMHTLVQVLCKREAPLGLQADLEDAVTYCSQILAYLQRKDEYDAFEKIEFEDILLKLALSGEYCARGIKRAAAEIVGSISADPRLRLEPTAKYELEIQQQLQLSRLKIIQDMYQKMVEVIVRVAKDGTDTIIDREEQTTDEHAVAIAQGIHTMDLYWKVLSLGFYPLTENERNAFGMADLSAWAFYESIRNEQLQIYQTRLSDAIKEKGAVHFGVYMRAKINSLGNLTAEERANLLGKFTDMNDGKWTEEETLEKFHRLFFVLTGILKRKTPLSVAWITEDPEQGWSQVNTSVLEESILCNSTESNQPNRPSLMQSWSLIEDYGEKS